MLCTYVNFKPQYTITLISIQTAKLYFEKTIENKKYFAFYKSKIYKKL